MASKRHKSVNLLYFAAIIPGLAGLFPSAARCADATGEILGSITDPSGAAVPGALVTITNSATSAVRTGQSEGAGEYLVPLLPPGAYVVHVSKQGFREAVTRDIRLAVDQTARVDFQLQIGPRSDRIVIEGATPLVETDTAKVGYALSEHAIQALPLNQRNFLEFALLVPGAQTPAQGSQNIGTGGSFSINGAREQSNNFLLDGTDNNDPLVNQYGTLPPVEAIQEFKVQTSLSSADYGRTAGAQINVALKSGTNSFHGSAFEFVRNRHLDAKNFFDRPDCLAGSVPGTCGPIPGLDRSQYGASFGGPVRRDKTFFFLAYEGLNLRQAITLEATVPSQNQIAAAFAAVPASRRDPAGLAALNLYPAANVGTNLAASNLFISSPLNRTTANQGVARIDHQLSRKDSLSTHYAVFENNAYQPLDPKFIFSHLPGFGDNALIQGHNAGLSWTRAASAAFTNEARIGFNRRHTDYLQQGSGEPLAGSIGFPQVSSNPIDYGYPNISVTGFDGIGTSIVLPQVYTANTFEYADNAAWNPGLNGGRHQLRFGADVRRIQDNFFLDALKRGEWLFAGRFTGSPLTDLISGLPYAAIAPSGNTDTGLRATGLGVYLEDAIRAGQNLTVTLALRYEYNQPAYDIRNRLSVPDFSSNSATCSPRPDCQFLIAGANGIPRATYQGKPDDFGPRVGIAWRPFGENGLVVRSGYGIYYDAGLLNVNLLPRSNPPFYEVNQYANFGTSTIQSIIQPATAVSAGVQSVYVSPNFRDAYMQQWHLTLERQIDSGFVASAAYVGSNGIHLLDQRQANQPLPASLAPYPQFGPIRMIAADGLSNYNALELRAERRLAKGATFLAAYTWSKSIDDTSSLFGSAASPAFPQNSYDLRAERGPSDFNSSQRFVLSAIYPTPQRVMQSGTSAGRFANAVFGAWQLSAIVTIQSGHPFTVNRGTSQSGTGTTLGFFDRPNVIADPFKAGPVSANPNPACSKTISQGGRAADVVQEPGSWFNACAFAAPATVSFGDEGRDALIGPGLAQLDLELMKSFTLGGENRRLEVRAQAFNLLNHPNFDLPNANFDSPAFGAIQSANAFANEPPRQIQLGLRYSF